MNIVNHVNHVQTPHMFTLEREKKFLYSEQNGGHSHCTQCSHMVLWQCPNATNGTQAMKEETRKRFEEEIYKGKNALMRCEPSKLPRETLENLGAEGLTQYTQRWMSVWQAFVEVQHKLTLPTADTVEVSNTVSSTMRRVNRLLAKANGESLEELEEEAAEEQLSAVEKDSAMDRIIRNIQASGQSLMNAYQEAVDANPLAESLELFKDMKIMAAKIMTLPRDVAKLRGLK